MCFVTVASTYDAPLEYKNTSWTPFVDYFVGKTSPFLAWMWRAVALLRDEV